MHAFIVGSFARSLYRQYTHFILIYLVPGTAVCRLIMLTAVSGEIGEHVILELNAVFNDTQKIAKNLRF